MLQVKKIFCFFNVINVCSFRDQPVSAESNPTNKQQRLYIVQQNLYYIAMIFLFILITVILNVSL